MGKDKSPFQPRRLGKFLLLDHLASGGMAELYRAKTVGASGFEKQQAVKSIYPQYTNNEDFRRMFEREAQICSQLQHANIVQVMDFIRVGDNFLLSMEFVDGINVRQLLGKCEKQHEKIPVEISAFIAMEVCRGLDYAHKKKDPQTHESLKIIHRDISPQNIMLSYEGSVKIVDFGIAKARNQSEITRSGVVKGKFAYMSPEQASGYDSIDHRTDIFSAGIVLFELLSQERLFAGDDDLQTIRRINECQVPKVSRLNPDVNYELEKIVFKALAKDPDQRFQSAGEMAMALQKLIVKTWEYTTSEHVGQWVRKLFAEEILEERKRHQRQEELARQIGQNALESVRDTLMPTDGDVTKIRNEKETRISGPLTQQQRTRQDTEPNNGGKTKASNETKKSGPTTTGVSINTATNKSNLLDLTSFTQMSATKAQSKDDKKSKLEKLKLAGSENHSSSHAPPPEDTRIPDPASREENEKTLPQGIAVTNPMGTPSTTTQSESKLPSFDSKGSAEPLEVMSSQEYTSREFQSMSTSGRLGHRRGGPGGGRTDLPPRKKKWKATAPSPQSFGRAALVAMLLGLVVYALFKPSKKPISTPVDPCIENPERCLTEKKAPGESATLPAKPTPTQTIEIPDYPDPKVSAVPLTLPTKMTDFNPASVPEDMKKMIAEQGPVDSKEIAGKRIHMKMFPEGTEVKFNKKKIGMTPFIWNVPSDANGSDSLTFEKTSFLGLSMKISDLPAILQDRRTGSNMGGSYYDFVLEYNLQLYTMSVIDIFVNPVANIYIDSGQGSRYVGQSPLQNYEIPSGKHEVRMVNQLLNLDKTVTISVPAGKRMPPFEFTLQPRAPSGQ